MVGSSLRLARFPLALSALLATGCSDLVGQQDSDGYFRVGPRDDGTFWGWTEITISEDPYDADYATLVSASLEAREGQSDMTFLSHIVGEVVTDEKRVPVVRGTNFPEGEVVAPLDVIYEDDLRPLFVDDTIRVEWVGTVNPEHTGWPENGYEVGVLITVDIE